MSYTIEEMKSKMTVFFSKNDGEIVAYSTGVQDMGYFSDRRKDFELIWDFIIVPIDNNVMNNKSNYRVNTETKSLEIKPEAIQQNNYPIASS